MGIDITNCSMNTLALENIDCTEKGKSQHWIGVGFDRAIHYGKMMVTDMGKELINTGRFPELYDEEMNWEFVEEIYKFLQIENRESEWLCTMT